MFGNGKFGKRGETLPEPHEGLPDSSRPSGLCPRCGKQSSFVNTGSLDVTFDYSSYSQDRDGKKIFHPLDRVSVLFCRHCKQGITVIEETWIGDHPQREGVKGGGQISYRGINWWPLTEANLSTDIPKSISEIFNEATMTFAANCPRASVVMARRSLEAVTVDKGETKGNLYNRLDALNKKGIIHPSLIEWAQEVRLVGNKGAHFDPIEKVDLKDAKQLLSFVRELLKYTYELPAELERRRSKS